MDFIYHFNWFAVGLVIAVLLLLFWHFLDKSFQRDLSNDEDDLGYLEALGGDFE